MGAQHFAVSVPSMKLFFIFVVPEYDFMQRVVLEGESRMRIVFVIHECLKDF